MILFRTFARNLINMKNSTYKLIPSNKKGKPNQYEVNDLFNKPFIDFAEISMVDTLYNMSHEPMHSHDFFLLIWFFQGEGKHVIDFKEYDIDEDTIFFLPPSRVHSFKDAQKCQGVVVNFSTSFLTSLLPELSSMLLQDLFTPVGEPTILKLEKADKATCLECLDYFKKEYFESTPLLGHESCICALFTSLIIHLRRAFKEDEISKQLRKTREYKTYREFKQLLERMFTQMHYAKAYAESMETTIGTLDRSCKKITNRTANKLINERLILEANRILVSHPKMSIKEIALKLGFEGTSNFVNFYKSQTDITPSVFRATNL